MGPSVRLCFLEFAMEALPEAAEDSVIEHYIKRASALRLMQAADA